MEREAKVLQVKMLGSFSVIYGEQRLLLGKVTQSRFLQLLIMLWIYREQGVPKETLIQEFYEWEDIENKNNGINNMIYRIRKQLKAAGLPGEGYVTVKNGVCRWNSEIPMEIDVEELKACYQKASACKEQEKKIVYLSKICSIYQGDLLPQIADERWVMREELLLKQVYRDAMREYGGILEERGEYQKLDQLCETAARLLPYEGWAQTRVGVLVKLGKIKEARQVCKQVLENYAGDHEMPMTKNQLESYEDLEKCLMYMNISKESIGNMMEEQKKEEGAYYCPYPSFLDAYRWACRFVMRGSQKVSLVSFTLEASKKGKKYEERAQEWLRLAICRSLRQGDLCTRYSKNKYLVMLIGEEMPGQVAEKIAHRIEQYFLENSLSDGCCLHFSLEGGKIHEV